MQENQGARRGRGRVARERTPPAERRTDYRQLRNPFEPHKLFSDDRIAHLHETALRVLEELGLKVLLPEARALYKAAGALVDEDSQMVRLGREIIAEALKTAPRAFAAHGADALRDVPMAAGNLCFVGGSSAPNATDLERGRRPGALADFERFVKLVQHFDVVHLQGPHVEPQDIEARFRHYATTRAMLTMSDKVPYVYARGTPQVMDGFEMIRLARGLSEQAFSEAIYSYTVINTNSPRQLDVSMAQGIIDFARHGQLTVITPFCLAGAMAPVTVAGALTLQHAEALAGIALAQLAKRGAPVIYGSFCSNVDMKSGAPAFGTPEHVKATLGAGQLARYIGLPWRAGGGTASNAPDAQAANETQFALWGTVLGGATMLIHSAGWLEGGLSNSFEKFILDVETLQTIAELCVVTPADEDAIAFDAITEVQPGGHFFAAQHTMARYRTAFYEPLVADWSNFGNWTEAGSRLAHVRALGVWQKLVAEFEPPAICAAVAAAIDPYIERRRAEGGAPPVS